MTLSYSQVYLSPHYDDVSLSCGGAIHQHTQAGQAALVITIFAAPPQPDEPFSPFAEAIHHSWGNPADVVATRQAEDRASLEILGADYLRLNFSDCIYRGHPERGQWFYQNESELFGSVHPADQPLVNRVVEALLELIPGEAGETTIYAPLGVGHHVDHQIAHVAAWQLRQRGWPLAFYEDYPYADPDSRYAAAGWDQYSLTATLAAPHTANLQPQERFLAEENLQAKIKSVRAYTSQLSSLFDSEAKMEDDLRNYALRVGAGKLAERIWLPA